MNCSPSSSSVTNSSALNGLTLCLNKSTSVQLTRLLGIGTFAQVYEAIDSSQQRYACKVLSKRGLSSEDAGIQRMEIDIHRRLSHPNILSVDHVIENEDYLFLITERCAEDLYESIITSGGISHDSLVRTGLTQIISAVEYAHSKGIFHRDLKPENILVSLDGSLKLADWGLASTERISKTFECGSRAYMSPELFGGYLERVDYYTSDDSDVWALGIILINMRFGCGPWREANESDPSFVEFATNPITLKHRFNLSNELYSLLLKVFSLTPRRRISAKRFKECLFKIKSFTADLFEDDLTILTMDGESHDTFAPKLLPPTVVAGKRTATTDSGLGASLQSTLTHF